MKKIFVILTVVAAIHSCNQKRETKTKPIDENTAPNQNIELAKLLFQHFNNHEWQKMAKMYSETAYFKDPSFGTEMVTQTQQETTEKYTELNKLFPDIHDEIIKIYPSGKDHIIVEFISTGTAPDNSKFKLPVCTILTFENGKIIKDFTYYDGCLKNNI